MILSGCSPFSGSVFMNYRKCNSRSYYSASVSVSCLPAKVPSSTIWNSSRSRQELKSLSFGGPALLHISAASTPFLTDDQGGLSDRIPMLTRRQRSFISPRASKDVPYSFQDPVKKPRWWWRTLACLSYLKPLREPWLFAKTAYHLLPFSEEKCLTYPFRLAHGRLPWWWFGMAYLFIVYLGVVKKEWPHFYMFHNMMAMLLAIPLQMMSIVSVWMPLTVYLGKVGMHFWTAFTFVYLFTVLACMRCALAGKHADVPFFCDAAYILSLYRRGR